MDRQERTIPTDAQSEPVAPESAPGAKPELTLVLASPRGFCAGVDRAIKIVELAIERYGAPVYVRHEIVHNQYVVDSLKAKGAIFVEELDEVAVVGRGLAPLDVP